MRNNLSNFPEKYKTEQKKANRKWRGPRVLSFKKVCLTAFGVGYEPGK